MGWLDAWGGSQPAGDWPDFDSTGQSSSKSYGILRWVARGGSHVNFYNWAGGNHFGRNAGSSMVNVYYWKAPVAADNLAQGPERQHMVRTYQAIVKVAAQIEIGRNAITWGRTPLEAFDRVPGPRLAGRGWIYCCYYQGLEKIVRGL